MTERHSGESKSGSAKAGAPRTAIVRGLAWYLFGTAMVGVAAGLFAGLSASPVIGVLLPILFGLLGGAGGFYIASTDTSSDTTAARIRLFGIALTTLMLGLVPSALYGMLLRTGLGISALLPRTSAAAPAAAVPAIVVRAGVDPVQPLELLLLRRKLQMVGATPQEQQAILTLAQERTSSAATMQNLSGALRRLALLDLHAAEQFTPDLIAGSKGQPDERIAGDLFRFTQKLAPHYQTYAQYILDHVEYPLSGIQTRLTADGNELGQLIHGHDGVAWLQKHEEIRTVLWNLELSLAEEVAKTGSSWMSDSRFSDAFNKFAETLRSQPSTGTDRSPKSDPINHPAFAP